VSEVIASHAVLGLEVSDHGFDRSRPLELAFDLRCNATLLTCGGSKQSKKRKAALDWYGGPYDLDDISEQQIITALSRIAKIRRQSR
jgi:hypothetical protein